MKTPEEVVRATYQSVRQSDAPTLLGRLASPERTQYLERIRSNHHHDQEQLSEFLARQRKDLPSLATLEDVELLRLILNSVPSSMRKVYGEVFRSSLQTPDTCRVRVRTGLVDSDGAIEMDMGFDENKQFPQGSGILQDELLLRLEADEWRVVPWPFGLIPLPRYANVMYLIEPRDQNIEEEG
jgi:hypothetical protein